MRNFKELLPKTRKCNKNKKNQKNLFPLNVSWSCRKRFDNLFVKLLRKTGNLSLKIWTKIEEELLNFFFYQSVRLNTLKAVLSTLRINFGQMSEFFCSKSEYVPITTKSLTLLRRNVVWTYGKMFWHFFFKSFCRKSEKISLKCKRMKRFYQKRFFPLKCSSKLIKSSFHKFAKKNLQKLKKLSVKVQKVRIFQKQNLVSSELSVTSFNELLECFLREIRKKAAQICKKTIFRNVFFSSKCSSEHVEGNFHNIAEKFCRKCFAQSLKEKWRKVFFKKNVFPSKCSSEHVGSSFGNLTENFVGNFRELLPKIRNCNKNKKNWKSLFPRNFPDLVENGFDNLPVKFLPKIRKCFAQNLKENWRRVFQKIFSTKVFVWIPKKQFCQFFGSFLGNCQKNFAQSPNMYQ